MPEISGAAVFRIGPPQIWPHLPALLVHSPLQLAAFAIRIVGPVVPCAVRD